LGVLVEKISVKALEQIMSANWPPEEGTLLLDERSRPFQQGPIW
jgi:hypothetical protein